MALRLQLYGNTIMIDGDFPDTLAKSWYMTPDNYQIEVLGRLRFIEAKTQSGRALLGGLNRLKGRICRIIPVRYDNPGSTITNPVDSRRSLIEYNPWTWNFKDKLLGIDLTNLGYDPDDVLFHELVHAFLQLAQIFRSKGQEDHFRQYDNREDFYAVLFTNIYVSERDKLSAEEIAKRLRGSHKLTFETLDAREHDIAQANDPALRFYKA